MRLWSDICSTFFEAGVLFGNKKGLFAKQTNAKKIEII